MGKKRKTLNFKNKAAYRKWLAYGHIHKKFKGRAKIKIRGKAHRVKHAKKRRR